MCWLYTTLSIIFDDIGSNGMTPAIKKPAEVTRKTEAVIGHILIACFVNNFFKIVTFKTNISDHFPVCILFLWHEVPSLKETTYLYKMLNLLTNLNTACLKLIGMKFNQI